MATVYKFVDEDHPNTSASQHTMLENRQSERMIEGLLKKFAEDVLGDGTRAYQVLKILVEPEASKDMCASCKMCDSKNFDIDQCVNYNANIGKWLGVNKTMIANKMRSIRKRFPEWLEQQDTVEAEQLLEMVYRCKSFVQ